MKKMNKTISRSWREFTASELKLIFNYMKFNEKLEDYKFLKFGLYSGLRRGEILAIKLGNLELDKSIINEYGTKNDNAKRIMLIHKELMTTLEEQIKDKNDDDYLFYN